MQRQGIEVQPDGQACRLPADPAARVGQPGEQQGLGDEQRGDVVGGPVDRRIALKQEAPGDPEPDRGQEGQGQAGQPAAGPQQADSEQDTERECGESAPARWLGCGSRTGASRPAAKRAGSRRPRRSTTRSLKAVGHHRSLDVLDHLLPLRRIRPGAGLGGLVLAQVVDPAGRRDGNGHGRVREDELQRNCGQVAAPTSIAQRAGLRRAGGRATPRAGRGGSRSPRCPSPGPGAEDGPPPRGPRCCR